jgi:hypothetical protein
MSQSKPEDQPVSNATDTKSDEDMLFEQYHNQKVNDPNQQVSDPLPLIDRTESLQDDTPMTK